MSRVRRVRVPTVLQMQGVECGAACLAMVLAHYGRLVSLEEVRAACGVSRDGAKASNIARAARTYGLDARGMKCEPAALRTIPGPTILHWNFNHFVVCEGFGRGRVYLNDPGTGRRSVRDAEFDEAFTGVALAFNPGPGFRPGGERHGMVGALRRRLAGSYDAVAFAVLAGLLLVVPGLVVPAFSRVFVDDVLVGGMHHWMRPLLGFMAATALCLGVLTWLQHRSLLRLETRLALGTSARFFWHVLHLPVQFFAQRFSGEIASRVALNDRVAQLLSGDLATAVLNAVVITFYAALMFRYDAVLSALVVATAVLNVGVLRFVSLRRVDLNQRLAHDRGNAVGMAAAGLANLQGLKSTGAESDFFAQWSGYYAKLANGQQKLGRESALLSALPPLVLALNSALLLGIGGSRVMDGHMSMGMLIAFQVLTLAFLNPVNGLAGVVNTADEVKGDMNRLDDVLRSRPDRPADFAQPDGAGKLSGQMELRRISFGYSRLEPALIQDFGLTLRPGSRVALVGRSGCGKSTVTRLVAGMHEPWAGEILFDGVSRVDIPRSRLTDSVAVVDQDVFVFEGTVRDNLTMWDPTVPEEALIRAGRDACIHDEIVARPGGYDCRVEERGRNFSGGQRQRMEIARALVNDPTILVLDEATSALDPSTEKQIDDNLRRRGCTCLIVAHRLSTIRDCDEIIVLEGGRIAQRGTHDELKGLPGPYADLIAAA